MHYRMLDATEACFVFYSCIEINVIFFYIKSIFFTYVRFLVNA